MIKTLIVAGLLSTTMFSGHANADLSHCGVDHSRFNPVELSDYQECWLDEFRGDDTSGVMGSLFWVNINDKYYSAPISTLRWDMGEAFKQSIVDDQISVAQQDAIRAAIAQLEAQVETANEVRDMLAENVISLEDYKKLDEQHKAKIAELEAEIKELKMIETDPDAYADGYAKGLADGKAEIMAEDYYFANEGEFEDAAVTHVKKDLAVEGTGETQVLTFGGDSFAEDIVDLGGIWKAGYDAGMEAAGDAKAFEDFVDEIAVVEAAAANGVSGSWNMHEILTNGFKTSITLSNGKYYSYELSAAHLDDAGWMTKADAETEKSNAVSAAKSAVTLTEKSNDAFTRTITVSANNADGQEITVSYHDELEAAIGTVLDVQNASAITAFAATEAQIAQINSMVSVEGIVNYVYNLGKNDVTATLSTVAAVSETDLTVSAGDYVKIALSNGTDYHIRVTSGTISDYAAMTAIRNSIGSDDEHWSIVDDFTENCDPCTATAFVDAIYDAGYAAAPGGGSSTYTQTIAGISYTVDENSDITTIYNAGADSITAYDSNVHSTVVVSDSHILVNDANAGNYERAGNVTVTGHNGLIADTTELAITLSNGKANQKVNIASLLSDGLTYTMTDTQILATVEFDAAVETAIDNALNNHPDESDEWKKGYAVGYKEGQDNLFTDYNPGG